MPALPSSPADPAIGYLADLALSLARGGADLLTVLAGLADPRRRRGIRHQLAVILGLAVCAVLAGARSFTAIAEWAADADEATLAGLGVPGAVPSESTFRRTLQKLDAGATLQKLDAGAPDHAAGAWAAQRTVPPPQVRRVIAVDGKTLRGSRGDGEDGRHLLAALDHAQGVVLGQAGVDAKTNEIPMMPTLLDRIEIRGAVITADALHAQREHARYLARRGAHYILTVKGNQLSGSELERARAIDWDPRIAEALAHSGTAYLGLGPAGHLAPDTPLAIGRITEGDRPCPAVVGGVEVDRVFAVTAAAGRGCHGQIVIEWLLAWL